MKELGKLLQDQNIAFDPVDSCIMCFPHIINICSTHIIKSFHTNSVDDKTVFNAEPPPSNPAKQTYEEAVKCNPIALCHSTIRAMCASGTQRDLFEKIIRDGNKEKWFRSPQDSNKIIQVPKKQLLHDVKTRWDSVFKMIGHFRELQPISNSQTFTCEHHHHNQIGYRPFPCFTS
jgi:hypothetical protein